MWWRACVDAPISDVTASGAAIFAAGGAASGAAWSGARARRIDPLVRPSRKARKEADPAAHTGWRRWLPDPKAVLKHRWLAWLGPRLSHPRLWHINRRGMAMALSIGLFFGLMVPVAQIPLAAIAAVLLRANLPLAVTSTLITNPVTFAPIYLFAYRLGNLILGHPHTPPKAPQVPASSELSDLTTLAIPDPGLFAWIAGWSDSVLQAGKPLIVGLLVLATVAGMSGYLIVSLSWRIRTAWVRSRRRKRFGELRARVRAAEEAQGQAQVVSASAAQEVSPAGGACGSQGRGTASDAPERGAASDAQAAGTASDSQSPPAAIQAPGNEQGAPGLRTVHPARD